MTETYFWILCALAVIACVVFAAVLVVGLLWACIGVVAADAIGGNK